MKKRMLALFLSLLFFCTACGQPVEDLPSAEPEQAEMPAETAAPSAAPVERHLAYETLALPGKLGNVHVQCLVGETLLTGGLAPEGPELWITDPQTWTHLPLALPEGTEFLYAAAPKDDGFVLLSGSLPSSSLDANNASVMNREPQYALVLSFYDQAGTPLDAVDLDRAAVPEHSVIKQLLCAGDGFVVQSPVFLAAVGSDGSCRKVLELDSMEDPYTLGGMALWQDQLVVLRVPNPHGIAGRSDCYLELRDPETLEILREIALPEPCQALGQLPDGSLLLGSLSEASGLLRFDLEQETSEVLFPWQEVGGPLELRRVFPLGESWLFYEPYEQAMPLLQWQDGPAPEPTVLTLAATGYSLVPELAKAFNRSQQDYYLEVTTYQRDYGNDAIPDRLRTEYLAGQGPDLYCFAADGTTAPLEREGINPKTVCLPLDPFLQQDETYSKDSFYPNLISAMEQEGQLYTLPLSFTLSTCQSASPLLTEPGLTLAELEQARQEAGPDQLPFPQWMTAENLFGLTFSFYISKYIDWETGVCSFDCPEFHDYLRWCKTWTGNGEVGNPDDPCLLTNAIIPAMENLLTYPEGSTPRPSFVYVGFPVEEGFGGMLHPSAELGISNQCQSPEGAWAFVRYCVAHYNLDHGLSDFPVLVSQLQDDFQRYKNQELSDFWGTPLHFYEDNVDTLQWLLINTTTLANQDQALEEILRTEAAAYFAGDKTVEEVSALIQDRAGLYLAEQAG